MTDSQLDDYRGQEGPQPYQSAQRANDKPHLEAQSGWGFFAPTVAYASNFNLALEKPINHHVCLILAACQDHMRSPEHFQFDSSFLAPFERSGGSSSNKAEVLNRLEQAVGQIQDSETFRRYLDVQSRFHKYSFGNVALILFQRPDATHVAGYNTWLKLHRYVRKGEHGIKIIVPMRRKENPDDPEDESRLFFGTGTVFDISQTEGEDLPSIEVPELHGDSHEGRELYTRLEQVAVSQGILVKWSTDDLPENTMGIYFPKKKEIVIREAAPLQMTKTLAHELAHHFAFGDLEQTRGEHESIAESVAYVVCSHFGLDTGARSFPYVAVWSKDKNVLKQVLGTVQKISARIIDEVEEESSS